MTSTETRVLVARAAPPFVLGSRRAVHLLERNLLVYSHTWLVVVSGFFEPVFYLLSIRLGLGALVGHVTVDGHAVSYTAFAAPALLASSAMNGAIYESTLNIYVKLKITKVYDAMLSTPLGANDVALGEIMWCLIRSALYATGFIVVMLAMGLVHSWAGVFLLPAATLVGFAFAAAGTAATCYMRSWQDFDFVNMAVLPMFLFSGTFYPLSTYPTWLQYVTRLTPLYHGVDLLRSLSLGTLDPGDIAHVAYLLAMGLAGLFITSKRLGRVLLA